MRCGLRDGGAATCRNTRGLDHRVATGIALAREGAFDAEHAERFADPRVVELGTPAKLRLRRNFYLSRSLHHIRSAPLLG